VLLVALLNYGQVAVEKKDAGAADSRKKLTA
jgi:hypothetical protein